MNIVICDDNISFGMMLSNYLRQVMIDADLYDGSYKIEYVSGAEALQSYLCANEIDILFLDISMPGIDGFEVAGNMLHNQPIPCLIFISNYEEKVYYSLRFEPFRFVRKSNYKEDAKEALLSAVHRITLSNQSIVIKYYSDLTYIRIPNIYYIEKEKMTNYVTVYTKCQSYRHRASITEMKLQLTGFSFLEAGQNLLVNPEHISHIDGCTINLDSGRTVNVSSRQISKVRADFLKYMRFK